MLFRRITPLLILTVGTWIVWCALTHRWSLEAWQTPLQLHGDPLEIYARVQAATEDLTQPLRGFSTLPRLAAPVGADWSRYPISDRVIFTFLGWLARGVGTFAAVNLAMAVVYALDALAFYLCARFLRWRREWACVTAMLFAFSSYNFHWSVTVSFSLTFAIPPLLLLCGWIARSAPAVRPRAWTWLAAALGVWFGGANPYFIFFAGQLVAWSILLQFGRRREFARWRAGAIFLSIGAISFLLHNAPYYLAPVEGDARLTLDRNYAGSEIYALKPLDLVIPPADHRIAPLAALGQNYRAQSALRSEFFINYLGVTGLVGLLLMAGSCLRPLIRRQATRVPDAALGLAWTLLFSAVGGINSLLALSGFDVFRASNRNSVFILVWALWFFGRWCMRQSTAWPLALRAALPCLVLVLGLADSLPKLNAVHDLQANVSELHLHRGLMHALETRLGPNARLFQLPSPPFPESGTVVNLEDYEQFLPYLTSHTLRFSYGALRGTPLSRALRALGRVPAAMMKDELENLGFNAIWVDRRGLAAGGIFYINAFKQLGLEEFPQTALPHVAVFLLHPSAQPHLLDLVDPKLFEPWDVILSLTSPAILTFDGWYDLEQAGDRSWRWAQNVATAGIVMPTAGRVELSFWAHSLSRGELVLEIEGREVWRHPVSPQSRTQRVIELDLAAGRHRLTWRYTGEVSRPATADGRKLGFAIENLKLAAVKN